MSRQLQALTLVALLFLCPIIYQCQVRWLQLRSELLPHHSPRVHPLLITSPRCLLSMKFNLPIVQVTDLGSLKHHRCCGCGPLKRPLMIVPHSLEIWISTTSSSCSILSRLYLCRAFTESRWWPESHLNGIIQSRIHLPNTHFRPCEVWPQRAPSRSSPPPRS